MEYDDKFTQPLGTFKAAFASISRDAQGRTKLFLTIDPGDYEAAFELSLHPNRMIEFIASRKPSLQAVRDAEDEEESA